MRRFIQTAYLVLRPFVPDDLDALDRVYSNAEVMRYISKGVRTREKTEEELAQYIGNWDRQGIGVWAVVDVASTNLAGMCGFVAVATLGYILDQPYWGRGFATEAAQACLHYGFTKMNYPAISAGALKTNTGSLRVIEKLGMHQLPNAYFDDNGGVFFTITREEWDRKA